MGLKPAGILRACTNTPLGHCKRGGVRINPRLTAALDSVTDKYSNDETEYRFRKVVTRTVVCGDSCEFPHTPVMLLHAGVGFEIKFNY